MWRTSGVCSWSLLFLVYVNDISMATNHGRLSLFADDTNVFIVSDSVKHLFDIANLTANDRLYLNALSAKSYL
jgi:hypothetical protein